MKTYNKHHCVGGGILSNLPRFFALLLPCVNNTRLQYLLELLLWENYKQCRAEASRHHCGFSTKLGGWVCEAKLEKVVKKRTLGSQKAEGTASIILASKSLFDQLLYAKYLCYLFCCWRAETISYSPQHTHTDYAHIHREGYWEGI